ncbi:MAG: EamA family transporter [Caulobacteraceae bacterium]|nr:EamA family transporter [Caulobacteraceae bacterium]
MLILAMASFQLGAVLSKRLFGPVGPQGTAALRIGFSAVILGLFTRPWRGLRLGHGSWSLVAYGVALGGMNTLFYLAIARIPLGIAVALEFMGPLAVATLGSRRPRDFALVALAAVGVALLSAPERRVTAIDGLGALLALGAGACWAAYIVFGQRAGRLHGRAATGLGMMVAALVYVPLGAVAVGPALFAPAILPAAILLAVLASALPYSLEMAALRTLPASVFGALMSLEPAIAAAAGFALLGERPTGLQWAGIAAVMAASFGSASTGVPAEPVAPA